MNESTLLFLASKP